MQVKPGQVIGGRRVQAVDEASGMVTLLEADGTTTTVVTLASLESAGAADDEEGLDAAGKPKKKKTPNPTMLEASDTSLNDRMRAVQQAVSQAYNQGPGDYSYVEVVFDDYVVVCKSGKLFRVDYTVAADGTVALSGEPVQVRVTYTPVKGTMEGQVFGPLVDDGQREGQLLEAADKATGKKWGVLIIQEGLSKNRNHYGRKVLQEAAPLYEGTRIFMDHEEGSRRFGRSTRDVAGFLKDVQPVLLASSQEADAAGIFGLAATAVITKPAVREELLDAWDEGKSDLFGLSHDVNAEAVTVMDKAGAFYDVTKIESVKSVDLVTNPAAGGRVLRLVASDTVPHSLSEDEAMLKKLIEAILASGNADQITRLKAFGENPTEDQVLGVYSEAMKPAPAAAAAAAAPVATPAPAATPAATSITEAEVQELRRDGATNYLNATLAGCSLPDAVKAHLRTRMTEAINGTVIPAKAAILAAVKEQVDLFAQLAEQHVVLPAQGHSIQMGAGRKQKMVEALDAFFGVKQEGVDANGQPKLKLMAQPMRSFRNIYVDLTGDSGISGRVSEATRLTEALDTSSFGEILGDSITRRMVAEYQMMAQAVWRGTIAEVVPVTDFRTQRRMRFGGYPNLATVGQGAPYPAMTSPTDEEATYSPAKRGGTEQITVEMITNDDVGAIRRIPARLARAASQTLYEFVFDFMRTNAAIYDAVALAAAGHGTNISTTALSATQVTTLRNRIKKQADMSNSKRIGLSARYLFVPTDLEELAFQICNSDKAVPDASLAAQAEPAAPNFVKKIGITPVVVDYWTDTNDYWLTADVAQTPMIEIGFLGGREEPELFVQDTPNQGSLFSNDQITYKIRHTYGGAVLDFRGFAGGIVP